jgi:hypothetical protein
MFKKKLLFLGSFYFMDEVYMCGPLQEGGPYPMTHESRFVVCMALFKNKRPTTNKNKTLKGPVPACANWPFLLISDSLKRIERGGGRGSMG